MREGVTEAWGRYGAPLCSLRCMHESECAVDGEPYCLDCADLVLDRFLAVSIDPDLARTLPALTPGAELRAMFRRPQADPRSLSGESEQLRELRQQWEAAGRPGDAGRADRRRRPPAVCPAKPIPAVSRQRIEQAGGQLGLFGEDTAPSTAPSP